MITASSLDLLMQCKGMANAFRMKIAILAVVLGIHALQHLLWLQARPSYTLTTLQGHALARESAWEMSTILVGRNKKIGRPTDRQVLHKLIRSVSTRRLFQHHIRRPTRG